MSSADQPVAWVLNLDAEDELTHPGAHTPTHATQVRLAGLMPRLRSQGGLVRPDDEVVWPATPLATVDAAGTASGVSRRSPGDGFAAPLQPGRSATDPGLGSHPALSLCSEASSAHERPRWGRAWCPTRWALAHLERAGLRVPPAPSQASLRLVNHRRFAHELGQALPAAGYAVDAAQVAALLADRRALSEASSEGAWLLKRPLGYAGRGRRRILAGGPTAAEQAWIDASLRTGDGLQVEPWVTRLLDCALHGWLDPQGRCTWGAPTVQDVDATGAWRGTRPATPGELAPDEAMRLHAEAERTAQALHAAGYFGPFGLDAFRWQDARGQVRFQPRCELNARYSMGWSVGMGGFRPPAGLP